MSRASRAYELLMKQYRVILQRMRYLQALAERGIRGLPGLPRVPKAASALAVTAVGRELGVQARGLQAALLDEPWSRVFGLDVLEPRVMMNAAPTGHVDVANDNLVTGWAQDPDTPAQSIWVYYQVDGVTKAGMVANQVRTDLGNCQYGFTFSPPAIALGTHSVTVWGVDTTNGQWYQIPSTINVTNHSPQGAILSVAPTQITGYAWDQDTGSNPAIADGTGTIYSQMYVDGTMQGGNIYCNGYMASPNLGGAGQYHGFTVNLSTLGVGNHTVALYGYDAAAVAEVLILNQTYNVASAPTLTTASDTGISHTDNLTNMTTPTFTGTAQANATITLFANGSAVGSATAGSNGAYTVTSSTLSSGVRTMWVTSTVGGLTASSGATTITIDNTAPAVPTITTPTQAVITNSFASSISGTAEANSLVQVWVDSNHNGVKDANETTVAGSTQLSGGGTSFSTLIGLAGNSVNYFVVTATDAAGNVSTAAVVPTITEDSIAPATPAAPTLDPGSDSGAVGDGITNVSRPTIKGTAEGNSTVKLYDGATLVGTFTAAANGSWSGQPTQVFSDGTHNLTITATDAAANTSAASAAFALTIDTVAPATPTAAPVLDAGSDSGTVGDGITNVNRPTLKGAAASVEANSTVKIYDGASLVGSITAAANGSWSGVPTQNLGDGVHSLTVTAMDSAGNTSAASAALALTIDTVAPATPAAPTLDAGSDSGAVGDGITNVNRPAIKGTAEGNSTVKLYDGATLVGTFTAAANGSWSRQPTQVFSDGTHNLTITATDAAGNTSAASAAFALTIDTVAPATATVPPAMYPGPIGPYLWSSTDTVITSQKRPEIVEKFYNSVEMNSTVTIYDGTTVIGSTASLGFGSWSFTPSQDLSDGIHSLTFTDTDAAGNTSGASPILTLTVDTTTPATPAAPILDSASDSGVSNSDGITNVTQPLLDGSNNAAKPGSTVSIYDGSTLLGSTTAGGNGSWSFTPTTPLTEGSHSLTVTATNAAGTTSAASSPLSVAVVTTAPPAPPSPGITWAGPLLPGESHWATSWDSSDRRQWIEGEGVPMSDYVTMNNPTIEVYDDGVLMGTVPISSYSVDFFTRQYYGNWNYTPSQDFSDGLHLITCEVVDTAGNVSAMSSAFTLGITPIKPLLASGSDSGLQGDNLTNVQQPLLFGNANAVDPGCTVTLYDGTQAVGTFIAASDGSWSGRPNQNLSNGLHYLTITVTNTNGTSAASTALFLTIDAAGPACSTPTMGFEPTFTELDIVGPSFRDSITVSQLGNTITVTDAAAVTQQFTGPFGDIVIHAGSACQTITVDSTVTTTTLMYTGPGPDSLIDNQTVGDATIVAFNAGDTVQSCDASTVYWVLASINPTGPGVVHQIPSFYNGAPMTLQGQTITEPSDQGTSVTFLNSSFWGTGPNIHDVNQGAADDCYFLAPLASLAQQSPELLRQMGADLGDGTYVVEFHNNGTPEYVRVDGTLAWNSNRSWLKYASPGADGNLWAPIFEKAYAYYRTGENTYESINWGLPGPALDDLGVSNSYIDVSALHPNNQQDATNLYNAITAKLNSGKAVAIATNDDYNPTFDNAPLSPNHCYAIAKCAYDSSGNLTFTFYNPWGIDGIWDPNDGKYDGSDGVNDGLVTVTYTELVNDCSYYGGAWGN